MIRLLGRVLTAPVTAPIHGVVWTAARIRDAAEEELYDEGRIHAELAELEARRDAGTIDEDTFAAHEDALFERLLVAREYAYRQGRR